MVSDNRVNWLARGHTTDVVETAANSLGRHTCRRNLRRRPLRRRSDLGMLTELVLRRTLASYWTTNLAHGMRVPLRFRRGGGGGGGQTGARQLSIDQRPLSRRVFKRSRPQISYKAGPRP